MTIMYSRHAGLGLLLWVLGTFFLYGEPDTPVRIVSTKTEWTSFAWNGSRWSASVIAKTVIETYNTDGQVATSLITVGKNVVLERILYEYQAGKLIRIVTSDHKKKVSRTVVFDTTSSALQLSTLSADGAVIERESWTLDGRGLLVRAIVSDPEKNILRNKIFAYGNDKTLESQATYSADGQLLYLLESSYQNPDAAGNWTIRLDVESFSGVRARPKYSIERTITYAEAYK